MFKDYYNVLGVPSHASAEQIRGAFKQLALRCHPDKMSTAQSQEIVNNTMTFTEVQEAYEVLGDVARRYLYDLSYGELVAQKRLLALEAQQQRQALVMQQARDAELTKEREKARLRALYEQQLQQTVSTAPEVATRTAFDMTQWEEKKRELCRPQRKEGGPYRKPIVILPSVEPQPLTPEESPTQPTPSPMTDMDSNKTTSHHQRIIRRRPKERPQPAESVGPSSRSRIFLLPSLVVPSAVSISFDDLDAAATDPSQRGYPLPSPESQGLPQDYFYQRAVSRTLQLFFASELQGH